MSRTPTQGSFDGSTPDGVDELTFLRAETDTLRAQVVGLRAEVEGLRIALDNRAVIEQAKGVLMCVSGVDADEAFAALVRFSQNSNVKLRKVAEQIVRLAPSGGLRDGVGAALLAALDGSAGGAAGSGSTE